MERRAIRREDTTFQIVLLDGSGNRVSGVVSTQVVIRLLMDSQASQNVNVLEWQELDPIDFPGVYTFKVLASYFNLGVQGLMRVTPNGVLSFVEQLVGFEVQDTQVTDLLPLIQRNLGLSLENYRLSAVVYNTQGQMVSGQIQLFSNSADVLTQNAPLATYNVVCQYDTKNRLIDYRVALA